MQGNNYNVSHALEHVLIHTTHTHTLAHTHTHTHTHAHAHTHTHTHTQTAMDRCTTVHCMLGYNFSSDVPIQREIQNSVKNQEKNVRIIV